MEGHGSGARSPSSHGVGRQTAYVNHFYFYLWDPDWGGAFWKTNAYAPYPIWLWLNGHEWAKRQLERAGIAYQALDNGFRSLRGQLCPTAGLRRSGRPGSRVRISEVMAHPFRLKWPSHFGQMAHPFRSFGPPRKGGR